MIKYYEGGITLSDIRSMPDIELYGYIDAANKMSGEAEPKKNGLTGQKAIDAMKTDPSIRFE